MVKHNEHSIKLLQLTDLSDGLQVSLEDIRPHKLKKQRKKEKKEGRKCNE